MCRILEPMRRVGLSSIEYVLLKSIVYCHSFIEDLSPKARLTLNTERNKYAMILMKYLQTEHGVNEGAKRYAEILALIQSYFYFAQRRRQIHLMIDVNFQDCYVVPPVVKQIMLK